MESLISAVLEQMYLVYLAVFHHCLDFEKISIHHCYAIIRSWFKQF